MFSWHANIGHDNLPILISNTDLQILISNTDLKLFNDKICSAMFSNRKTTFLVTLMRHHPPMQEL